MSETKPDSVPGLGFKDKDKALETIKNLEGRDTDYQKLAIKGLVGRAKRTLTLTKDKEKLKNINEALTTFNDWLNDFEKNNLSKESRPYLPLNTIKIFLPLKSQYKLKSSKSDDFIDAYKNAKGEYKTLRTVSTGENKPTWDIVRNTELKQILADIEKDKSDLWNKDDLPTKEHVELILWGYSPDASKIKKNLSKIEEKLKVGENSTDESSNDEKNDDKKNKNKKKNKRKSKSSSDEDEDDASSSEESPKKKTKK